MQDELFETPFVISRERRDATVVIRGFVYQVNSTLLQWIGLAPDQHLELEAGEDIDSVQKALAEANGDAGRLLQAIKHRERNLTLRSPEALSALAIFQEHRQSNPSLKLGFRYITNASIGSEAPPITDTGTPGIHLWERVRGGSIQSRQRNKLVSAIKKFLLGCAQPEDCPAETWKAFRRYVRTAAIAELHRFIDAFEWSTDQPSPDDLEGQVKFELIRSGTVASMDDAQLAFQHLFHFVFTLLSRRGQKVLTAQMLSQELKTRGGIEAGGTILAQLKALEQNLHERFDRLEAELAPIPGQLQELIASHSRLEQACTSRFESTYERDALQVDVSSSAFHETATSQMQTGSCGTTYQGRAASSVIFAALVTQNEALVESLSAHFKNQLVSIREAAQKGRRVEALKAIGAQKADNAAWNVIPDPMKGELLRLEAGILLSSSRDFTRIREALDEAQRIAPAEGDVRLRANLMFAERDIAGAIDALRGKEQPESRNLLALLLLLDGQLDESLRALPSTDLDSSFAAETRRIRALLYLHKRDIQSARTEIDNALAGQPDWPTLQCASAVITFYEGLSPAAIPSRFEGWPEPSTSFFALNTPEAEAKLRSAAESFAKWAVWPDTTDDERRALQAWQLACLALDRERRQQASEFVKSVLTSDPGQYRLLPWVLAHQFGGWDLAATESALQRSLREREPSPLELISLVLIQLHLSRPLDALSSLDTFEGRFPEDGVRGVWHHWRALALLSAGQIDAAKLELEQIKDPDKLDPLWSEIQRREAEGSGSADSYAAYLKARYVSSGSPLDLLEYCGFEAHRKRWDAVAELRNELMSAIATPDALRLAATATFNAGNAAACLLLLESRDDLFADPTNFEGFQRLMIASNQKLGRFVEARGKAEQLCAIAGSSENLLVLAQLQRETGDLKACAITSRRLYQREDLGSEQALRLVVLVRQEDEELAKLLWRRAVASDLPDEAVGAAVSLGYRLGLDRELKPLLARMDELGDVGKGGIERKTFDDVIAQLRKRQEDAQSCARLYEQGQIPIHLIPGHLRTGLVELYHGAPERFESDKQNLASLLIAHGGRAGMSPVVLDSSRRLNLDITSLLLAQHLKVLSLLEEAFAPLRLPPSIFVALGAMQDELSAGQPSQVDAAKDVLKMVEIGSLLIADEPTDYEEDPVLVEIGGTGWAKMCELCRRHSGHAIDFLPKVGSSGLALELPGKVSGFFVNPRRVTEVLRASGALSEDDYVSSLDNLGNEGRNAPAGDSLIPGSALYYQASIAKLLAGAKLLRPACQTFRVHMLREDLHELKATVERHEHGVDLIDWLNRLNAQLQRGLDKGTYQLVALETVPNEPRDISEKSWDAQCLLELLAFQAEAQDIIVADDRYVNGYQRRDDVPVATIVDVMRSLLNLGKLTASEYYRLMLRLRSGGFHFIPCDAEEILYHVMQAPVEDRSMKETPAMSVLRQHWAHTLLRSRILQPPGAAPSNAHGEVDFLQTCANEIRNSIVRLWLSDRAKTEQEKEIRAEWLLQTLYVDHLGFRALSGLPSGPASDAELVGVSLASLVMAALDVRMAGKCTSETLRSYLNWLNHRLLRNAFECDPNVLQSAAAFMRRVLSTLWRGASTDAEKKATARLILVLLEMLPSQLSAAVQADEQFAREVNAVRTPMVVFGELRFLRDDYLPAAIAAINGRVSSARAWGGEEISFAPVSRIGEARVEVTLKRQNGEIVLIADPLMLLLSDDPSDWDRPLRAHADWFDCSQDRCQEAIESILQEEDPATRIERVQKWRESSSAVFYSALPQKLESQRSFVADDLRPPSADGLLRHYRLPSNLSNTDVESVLDSASKELPENIGHCRAFMRLAGLPIPMPAPLVEQIAGLPEPDRRVLIKTLLRTPGSPVSAIHLVRLLTRISQAPTSKYWRLSRRLIRALLNSQANGDFGSFRALLGWTSDLFLTWPQTSSWSVSTRLAMVWGHAHKVFSTFVYLGVEPAWVKSRFENPEFGLSPRVFEHSPEYFSDVAHPGRLTRTTLLLKGLRYALAKTDPAWLSEDTTKRLLEMMYPTVEGQVVPALDLLRDHSLASDALCSFLGGELLDLSFLPENESASFFNREGLRDLVLKAIAMLDSPETGSVGWHTISMVLGDLPAEPDLESAIRTAVLQTNLQAWLSDLDRCEIVVESIAMRATALRDPVTTEYISTQLVNLTQRLRDLSEAGTKLSDDQRGLLLAIFDAVVRVSWGSPTADQPSNFSNLLKRVLAAFPEAAPIYRRRLNQLWPCRSIYATLMWPLLVLSRAGSL